MLLPVSAAGGEPGNTGAWPSRSTWVRLFLVSAVFACVQVATFSMLSMETGAIGQQHHPRQRQGAAPLLGEAMEPPAVPPDENVLVLECKAGITPGCDKPAPFHQLSRRVKVAMCPNNNDHPWDNMVRAAHVDRLPLICI
jgi:hypothetical protein